MTRGRLTVPLTAALLAVTAAPPLPDVTAARGQPAKQSAWLVRDLATGERLAGERPDRLSRPVPPGSFMKVPALLAALSAGTIGPETGIACEREVTFDGHRIRCSHPRIRRPIRPAEALALSCNVFFATMGRRLPRTRFDAVLRALGLPPSPPTAPMHLASTGLDASPASAEQLLTGFLRVVSTPASARWTAQARSVVLEGLRGAAVYGTAGAFRPA